MNTAVSSRWRSSPAPSLDAVSSADREHPAVAAAASTNPATRTHENGRLASFHRTVFIRCSSQNAASTPDPCLRAAPPCSLVAPNSGHFRDLDEIISPPLLAHDANTRYCFRTRPDKLPALCSRRTHGARPLGREAPS